MVFRYSDPFFTVQCHSQVWYRYDFFNVFVSYAHQVCIFSIKNVVKNFYNFKIHSILSIIHINNTDAGRLGHIMHHSLFFCLKGFAPIKV